MPRRCGRQTTRANHPADTTKQYWRIALYYPFLDHMVMELDSRLLKSEDRFLAEQFLSRFIDNITDNEVEAIYNTYQSDLMLSLEDFKIQEGNCSMAHKMRYYTKRTETPYTL